MYSKKTEFHDSHLNRIFRITYPVWHMLKLLHSKRMWIVVFTVMSSNTRWALEWTQILHRIWLFEHESIFGQMGLWTCGFSLFLQVSVSVLGWSSWICENAIDKRERERERKVMGEIPRQEQERRPMPVCFYIPCVIKNTVTVDFAWKSITHLYNFKRRQNGKANSTTIDFLTFVWDGKKLHYSALIANVPRRFDHSVRQQQSYTSQLSSVASSVFLSLSPLFGWDWERKIKP